MTRLRGYTPEEVMAEPMDVAMTPEAAQHVRSQMAERIATYVRDEATGNTRFYTEAIEQPRKDGSTVCTELITVYWRNQKTRRMEVHGVTRDITERKLVETALRENRRFLADPVENSGTSIYVKNRCWAV